MGQPTASLCESKGGVAIFTRTGVLTTELVCIKKDAVIVLR